MAKRNNREFVFRDWRRCYIIYKLVGNSFLKAKIKHGVVHVVVVVFAIIGQKVMRRPQEIAQSTFLALRQLVSNAAGRGRMSRMARAINGMPVGFVGQEGVAVRKGQAKPRAVRLVVGLLL